MSAVHNPRPRLRFFLLAIFAGIAFLGFLFLGSWQIYRLQWKLNLIERVNQRVHAEPVAAPGPDRWSKVTADSDEYRHVSMTGRFLYDQSALTQAVTDYGNGYWLLTPLLSNDGFTVLVNRGFVPGSESDRAREFRTEKVDASGQVTIYGLLRISEPGGGFLRHNDVAEDRWYSRDVAAIAASRKLTNVAPYFVDAAATQARPSDLLQKSAVDYPIAGLTVIAFHNNHLVYALTWYALALMVAGGWFWAVREQRKARSASSTDATDREGDDGEQN